MKHVLAALCCAVMFAVSGCATPLSPVLNEGEKAQVVEVVVRGAEDLSGTANLLEDIRYKTQNAAYRYSEEGREKILELDVQIVRISSPGAAFLVTGNSSAYAKASLIDKPSGKLDKAFVTDSIILRMSGIIGAIAAASVDPIEEEQKLASLLADNTMKLIYGEEYAKQVAERVPSREAEPNYPMSYDDARKKLRCEAIERQNAQADSGVHAKDGDPPILEELPDYCSAYLGAS
jgi:hypothetical protein